MTLPADPAEVPKPPLSSSEAATSAQQLLYFRDSRAPHEIQFELERDLMTLFAVAMKDERLTMTTAVNVVGAPYEIELRFESATGLKNFYSLRVVSSWSKQPPENHDYFRKQAEGWFGFWTREFKAVKPPKAAAAPSERYQKVCLASLNAEAGLDSVPALQQAIVAAMKRGGRFTTSHKEGGTNITWNGEHFVRSDFGDCPSRKVFSDEAEFLGALRKFYDWETSKNTHPAKCSELVAWKLMLRLLRNG